MSGLVAALLLAAATPAQLQALQADDQRVMTVGYRLSTRGVALCHDAQAPQYGFRVHVRGQYPKRDWLLLRELFGLDRRPGIVAIAPDGPAAQAGIAIGDALYEINGQLMLSGDSEGYAAVARVAAALKAPKVNILLLSGRYVMAGVPGCASDIELIPSAKLNAKADGRIVQITTGVLGETRSDDELAFVVAHEMAHNILGHRVRLDRIGRNTANIRATEIEADRLGVRLMHAAGYDPAAAARFWERFGKKTGAGIFSDGRHLRTKARVQLLRDEAATVAR